jgi:probable DNA repair protein
MSDDPPRRHPLNARLVAHLEGGGSVLTASRRQARLIRRLFDQAQLEAGRRSWPTADVLPLQAWATARWQEAAWRDSSLPVVMSDPQAAWPWRRHGSALLDNTLVDAQDLAAAARRAWASLLRYGGSLAQLGRQALNRDQQQFLAWALQVESELGARGWLDPAAIELALAPRVGLLGRSAPLLLAGFAPRPAAVVTLAQALSQSGWSVDFAPLAGPAGAASVFAAADPDHEMTTLAGWLRARLESRPGARLGVFVPDLQSRRGALERRFEAVLQPELELPGSQETDRMFDFAGGAGLSSLRIAEAALDCIDCCQPRIRLETLSRVLRCRHLALAGEAEARVRLDVELRRQSLPERRLPTLADQARGAGCPLLAETLESACQALGAAHVPAHLDHWAEAFSDVLRAWGWPGEGPLASDEYQAAEALRDRLAELSAMSLAAPPMTLEQARGEFARLLAAPFQPERGEAAVIVYDSLEPPGVAFDGLWVAGMTASAWPQAAAQDPFLPLALQGALGMPGVASAAALSEALATTEAWLGSAPEVVFSWARRQDDAVVEPSRILPPGPSAMAAMAAAPTRTRLLFAAAGLEPMPADTAPPLSAAEAGGGARIFELQAKCPFRAFAELRLAAGRLEAPSTGVDARGRGLLLHRALELCWGSLQTQAALLAASPQSLASLVDDSLARALAEKLPAEVGRRARALEAEWQRAALSALLEVDRGRPPFEVMAVEGEREASFAGLRLKVRIDRVDRVQEGLLILDYKTGRADTSQWRGARLDAPQLPLYSLLQAGEVAAVAFASTGSRGARLLGVGAADSVADGIVSAEHFSLTEDRQAGFSWPAVRERWAGWLASLAHGYLDGDAAVDPKQPQTCRQCHLQTLCRVAPELDAAPGEDEDE